MTDLAALARALHVAAVVHWIGGLTFVTFVVLPTLGDQKPETRAAGFAACSLGPNILRGETAAIAALSATVALLQQS